MPKKSEVDLSISGAVNALNDMFFELPEIVKEPTNERREQPVGTDIDDKPAKRTKPVGNTFNPEKKGKAAGGTKQTETDDSGGTEVDDTTE